MNILDEMKFCTACSACKSACPVQAISMKRDDRGFLYPEIDEVQCIECGNCRDVCPVNNKPVMSIVTDCYASYSKLESQRLKSTSGGIFYLLARYVISEGGVVFGAAYDEYQQVYHRMVDSLSDIQFLQGAKYVQSELKDVFSEAENYLKGGRKVLFSGTPCQIAGLKKYLNDNYNNLLTVDLVCHGVPSPKAWNEYVEYRRKQDLQEKKACNINLRSKSSGWSHYGYSVVYEYENGAVYSSVNGKDDYMKAFVRNLIIRPSCSRCQFKGVERCSDFTLGDFWGIWNLYPEMDDDKGTSLVLIHSEKGKSIWEQLEKDCVSLKVKPEDAYKENISLIKPSPESIYRDQLLDNLDQSGFEIISGHLSAFERYNKISAVKRIWNRIRKK